MLNTADKFIKELGKVALAIQEAHYANVKSATQCPKNEIIDLDYFRGPYKHAKKVKELLNKMEWL